MAIPSTVPLTLPELKAELQQNENRSDPSAEGVIERIAMGATRAVEGVLGYRIVSAPYIDTYDGGGIEMLLLRNPPADITHVFEDTSRVFDSSTELELGVDFLADYWQVGAGAGTGCRVLRRLNGAWPDVRQSVRVEYDGGWAWAAATAVWSGPEDIRRAIFITARRLKDGHKGLLGKQAVQMPGGGGVQMATTIELTAAVPKEAKELLAPYVWNTQAVW